MNKPGTAPDQHLHGVLLVGASAVLWSLGGLIVRSLDTTDPWTTIFWRSAFATVFLILFLLVRDGRNVLRLFRDMGWPGLALGVCFTGASVGFVVALAFASVAQTLMIMSAAPLVAAVLGWLVLGERIGPAGGVAIVGVMAGIILMMSADIGSDRSFVGAVVALGVTFCLACSAVIVRRWPHIRMTPATCAGTVMALLVSWPLAAPFSITGHDLGWLVFFGAGQLGVGLILFVTGARLIPAVLTALLGMLEPILGPAWVWLLLGEDPGRMTLIGGGLVVASVAAYTLAMARRRRN